MGRGQRPGERVAAAVLAAMDMRLRGSRRMRGAVLVDTDRGLRFLKASRLQPPEIEFVFAATEHLARRGYDRAVRLETTPGGRPFVEVDRRWYTVSPVLSGQVCDFDDDRQLRLATAALAGLHRAAAGFDPPAGVPDRVLWGSWPHRFRDRRRQLAAFGDAARRGRRTTFDRRYLRCLDRFLEEADAALDLLGRSAYVRLSAAERPSWGGFCHHDYTYHNILIAGDAVNLVDFDYCVCDLRLHDLGALVLRCLKRRDWSPQVAEEIIAAYDREWTVTTDELGVLAFMFLWPQDFWQVGCQYYSERQPWSRRRFLASLQRKVRGRSRRRGFNRWFARRAGLTLSV